MVTCSNCKEEVPDTLYCLKCGCPLYIRKQAGDGDPAGVPSDMSELKGNEMDLNESLLPKAMALNEVEIGPNSEELHDGRSKSAESNPQELDKRIEATDLEWIRMIRATERSNREREDVELEWVRLIKRELRRRLKSLRVVNDQIFHTED